MATLLFEQLFTQFVRVGQVAVVRKRNAVRAENPDIQQFECSVFNGIYVTKDVDQQYLDYLDSLRNDDAKAVQLQNEVESLEMHNEG